MHIVIIEQQQGCLNWTSSLLEVQLSSNSSQFKLSYSIFLELPTTLLSSAFVLFVWKALKHNRKIGLLQLLSQPSFRPKFSRIKGSWCASTGGRGIASTRWDTTSKLSVHWETGTRKMRLNLIFWPLVFHTRFFLLFPYPSSTLFSKSGYGHKRPNFLIDIIFFRLSKWYF